MNKLLATNHDMIHAIGEDISNFKDILETKVVTGYAVIMTYKEKNGRNNAAYGLRGDPDALLNKLTEGIAEYIAIQQFEFMGNKQ